MHIRLIAIGKLLHSITTRTYRTILRYVHIYIYRDPQQGTFKWDLFIIARKLIIIDGQILRQIFWYDRLLWFRMVPQFPDSSWKLAFSLHALISRAAQFLHLSARSASNGPLKIWPDCRFHWQNTIISTSHWQLIGNFKGLIQMIVSSLSRETI